MPGTHAKIFVSFVVQCVQFLCLYLAIAAFRFDMSYRTLRGTRQLIAISHRAIVRFRTRYFDKEKLDSIKICGTGCFLEFKKLSDIAQFMYLKYTTFTGISH